MNKKIVKLESFIIAIISAVALASCSASDDNRQAVKNYVGQSFEDYLLKEGGKGEIRAKWIAGDESKEGPAGEFMDLNIGKVSWIVAAQCAGRVRNYVGLVKRDQRDKVMDKYYRETVLVPRLKTFTLSDDPELRDPHCI